MANTIKIKRSSTPASVPALVYGEIAYCTDGKLYCGNASDVAAQVNSTDGGFYEVITISAHPANQTASGGSATFSVTASTAASHAMTYQWSRSTNSGSTWATITGATSSSLALSSLTSGENGYYYRVAITSGLTVATSNSATLTVLAAALTPTFGATTSTATGFTVSITNYSALYTWDGTATASGSVSVSGAGLVTVTGVAASTSSTATIQTTRAGYAGGSATVTATSSAGSASISASPASPQTGNRTVVFTANFSSYMSMYTWSVTGTGNSVTSGSGTTTPSIYFTTTTGTFTVTCNYYGTSMQPLSATASYTII